MIQFRNHIFRSALALDDSQPELSFSVMMFLQMLTFLLNLSYIPPHKFTYLRIINVICRPQANVQIADTSAISITLMLIYLTFILFPIKGRKVVAIIGLMLETPLFNFFVETSHTPQLYILLPLILLIQLMRIFIIDGQLDIDIINFQQIKQSWLNVIIKLVRLIQMSVFNFQQYQIIITITLALLYIIRNLKQAQSLQFIILSTQINLITLYYFFLVVFQFDTQFNTEIILLPFILKISGQLVQRFSYVNDYNLDRVYTLIIQQQNQIVKKKYQLNHLTREQAIIKLLSKDPIYNKQIELEDSIIYASALMVFDRKFEALKYLMILQQQCISKYKLEQSIITQLKLKRLETKCLRQIFRKLEQKQILQGKQVRDLMEADQNNLKSYHQIVNIISEKIYFLQRLQQLKVHKSDILDINGRIISLKEQLIRYYKRQPSEKSKNILIFYESEILNDFIEPQQYHSQPNNIQSFLGSYLTDKMIYLITEYQENLIIKRHSSKIKEILQTQDIINQKIDIFLPQSVEQSHKQLVKQMFDSGNSKYMRNLQDNILKLPDGYLITIEFALDVIFNKNTLQFVSFIQQSINQPMKMVAGQNFIITHISHNISQYMKPSQIIGVSLLDLIPNFESAIQDEDYQTFDQVQLIKNKVEAKLSVYTRRLQQQAVYFFIQIISIRPVNADDISLQSSKENFYESQDEVDEIDNIISPRIFSSDYIDQPINQTSIQRVTSPNSMFIVPFIQKPVSNNFLQKFDSDVQIVQKEKKTIKNLGYNQTISSQKLDIKNQSIIRKWSYFTKHHKILLALIILLLVIQQGVQIAQYVVVNTNMESITSDVQVLQIKNLIFQPLMTFLVTRWNILSYNNFYNAGLINKTYLNQLLEYPSSNINLGYDDLSKNIRISLNYQSLQEFYDNRKINLTLYTKTNVGQMFEFSVRESLNQMLNYQYVIKKQYEIQGFVVLDSPQVFYSYQNLITLNEIFTDINDDIYLNSVYRSENLIDSVSALLIIILVILGLFTILIVVFYVLIERKTIKYQNLLMNIDKEYLFQEISRLQDLQRYLQSDQEQIYNYQLNLEFEEFQPNNNLSNFKRKTRKINKSFINSISLGVIICYLLIIIYSLFCNYHAKEFLYLYPTTAKLYMAYSLIGTNIPTIYAMREVVYNRHLFPFYQDEQINSIINAQIIYSLDYMQQFTNKNREKDELITSEQFYNFLHDVNSQNLCVQFQEDLNPISQGICNSSMDGLIQRGLRELLIYITNQFKNEININKNFTKRLEPLEIGELEGAFIVSHLIKKVNQKFKIDISYQTQQQKQLAQVLRICFIILTFAFQIYFILTIIYIYKREYFLQQRIIYLIPRNVILFDHGFERKLRFIFTQEESYQHGY